MSFFFFSFLTYPMHFYIWRLKEKGVIFTVKPFYICKTFWHFFFYFFFFYNLSHLKHLSFNSEARVKMLHSSHLKESKFVFTRPTQHFIFGKLIILFLLSHNFSPTAKKFLKTRQELLLETHSVISLCQYERQK